MRFDKDKIGLVRALAEASIGGGYGHFLLIRKRDLLINALGIFMCRSGSRGFRPSPLAGMDIRLFAEWPSFLRHPGRRYRRAQDAADHPVDAVA
jgi:hypothetical protein